MATVQWTNLLLGGPSHTNFLHFDADEKEGSMERIIRFSRRHPLHHSSLSRQQRQRIAELETVELSHAVYKKMPLAALAATAAFFSITFYYKKAYDLPLCKASIIVLVMVTLYIVTLVLVVLVVLLFAW